MNHVKCDNLVGIELSTAAVVAIHIGIDAELGKRFPIKVVDIYKRFARKINEDKLNFICSNCGSVSKEEVYSDCDYCNRNTLIEEIYIGTNIAGVYCTKCDKPEEYTLSEKSLYEQLKESGLGL